MDNVINFKQQRKAKTRSEKDKKASENRAAHGRTKQEKDRQKHEDQHNTKLLDGHKREPGEVD